jgi:hypothetical protein
VQTRNALLDQPHPEGFLMKTLRISIIAMGTLLVAAAGFAQTPAKTTQKTQDGNGPTTVGPASKPYKQHTQGLPPGEAYQQDGSSWQQRSHVQPTKQQ